MTFTDEGGQKDDGWAALPRAVHFAPSCPPARGGQDAEDFPGEPQKSRLKRCRRRDAARCIEFAEKVEMEIMGCHCWTNPIHGEHLTRIAFEIPTLQCTYIQSLSCSSSQGSSRDILCQMRQLRNSLPRISEMQHMAGRGRAKILRESLTTLCDGNIAKWVNYTFAAAILQLELGRAG